MVKGDVVKGPATVDAAVGEVKDAGRAGTEGGVGEEEDPAVLVEAEVVAAVGAVGAGEEVLGAGTDGAVVAMVPLRSQGFGGEPIVQIGRTDV